MVKSKKKKVTYEKAWYALAVTRVTMGFIFLWAFFDKMLGLGFSTPTDKAWLLGGSPTTGYLTGVEKAGGPFADMLGALAGNPFIDFIFMLGLFGIGIALILGVGLRVAAVAGTILLVMMWAGSLPIKTNPLVDDHIVYAMMLWVFALGVRKWSVFNTWSSIDYVKKHRWLW